MQIHRLYKCDVPMAEKKGLLKYCNKRCNGCIAAIWRDSDVKGTYSHTMFAQGDGASMIEKRNRKRWLER